MNYPNRVGFGLTVSLVSESQSLSETLRFPYVLNRTIPLGSGSGFGRSNEKKPWKYNLMEIAQRSQIANMHMTEYCFVWYLINEHTWK